MTKEFDSHSAPDSEVGSVRGSRASRLGAILCPVACALVLVCVFAASFVGARLAYDQYDRLCAARRFDHAKLHYVFRNSTLRLRPM